MHGLLHLVDRIQSIPECLIDHSGIIVEICFQAVEGEIPGLCHVLECKCILCTDDVRKILETYGAILNTLDEVLHALRYVVSALGVIRSSLLHCLQRGLIIKSGLRHLSHQGYGLADIKSHRPERCPVFLKGPLQLIRTHSGILSSFCQNTKVSVRLIRRQAELFHDLVSAVDGSDYIDAVYLRKSGECIRLLLKSSSGRPESGIYLTKSAGQGIHVLRRVSVDILERFLKAFELVPGRSCHRCDPVHPFIHIRPGGSRCPRHSGQRSSYVSSQAFPDLLHPPAELLELLSGILHLGAECRTAFVVELLVHRMELCSQVIDIRLILLSLLRILAVFGLRLLQHVLIFIKGLRLELYLFLKDLDLLSMSILSPPVGIEFLRRRLEFGV